MLCEVRRTDDQTCLGDSLGERVEAVGLLGVGEGDPHARGERRVQDDGGALVPGRQVHRGHRADALAVQDDVLGADAVPERNRDDIYGMLRPGTF